ncbi:endonuclease/exonuclease/phosphatase family metal-dependent hydrolase [Nonomuraea polychroma]|uniref:Endonuclease/exonuclease/phosphatase family metal-dependent hydrolase n=1 Tax=Nonomuraea polychroma TaxID=46176 RepID=A0A438M9J5_9ACTN|nr:endonuclease/exonuclease/phosphatase family protein [Nonomuraea polychroma]RVX42402.1 endonuclease/exonuclease/phosphatase family metal-dependent hydrolase [Nonomuraea polychroma]
MLGHVLLLVAGSLVAPAPSDLSVMTWNVCTGTNSACRLYRASAIELAETIGTYALKQPIKPDVIFLQEFCTGATGTLELWLEQRTGRRWTIGSWGLLSGDGAPYACHPDRLGRPRGAQSIAVAVAGDAASFAIHPLPAPSWYVKRAAVCATIPARKVHACGTHLSSGAQYDDRQPGAPYRTRQLRRLLEIAANPGHRTVVGGDLNVSPPDSGYGSAAGRRAVVPFYRAYQECDQRGARRTGRWTREGKKIDYLFAPKGTVRRCDVDRRVTLSDHKPVYVKLAL